MLGAAQCSITGKILFPVPHLGNIPRADPGGVGVGEPTLRTRDQENWPCLWLLIV